jgi:Spy/CpxP family protein refolding chaperone
MKTTQKILIAGIVVLVILNLTTLSYIFFTSRNNFCSPPSEKRWDKKNILKEKLHLTDIQNEQVLQFKKDHRSKVSELRKKIDSLRKQEFETIKSAPFDADKANNIALAIGNAHTDLEKQNIAHFLEIRKILTQDQLPYFIEFIDFIKDRKNRRQLGDYSGRRFRKRDGDREDRGFGDDQRRHRDFPDGTRARDGEDLDDNKRKIEQ